MAKYKVEFTVEVPEENLAGDIAFFVDKYIECSLPSRCSENDCFVSSAEVTKID